MASSFIAPGQSQDTRPVSESERAEILDVLRGFALFGILLTHVPSFSGYDYLPSAHARMLDAYGIDGTMAAFVDLFIDGKFVSLFSLLFGIGFAIQMRRVPTNDLAIRKRFRRRLIFLLGVGLAHMFLLWQGDILTYYALLGFVLLGLRNASPRKLTVLSFMCLAMPAVSYVIIYAVYEWLPGVLPSGDSGVSGYTERLEAISSVFATGTFTDVLAANFSFWTIKIQWMLYDGRLFTIFGMFLLGAALGKLKVHYRIEELRRSIRRVLLVGGTLGMAGSAFVVYWRNHHELYPPTMSGVFESLVEGFARPGLGFAYAALLCIVVPTAAGRAAHFWFSAPGRMALTTYLSQTVICIGLFYGYGLGMRNTIGQTESLLAAILIFAGQSWGCRWWLKRYRYGPLEWIWRQFTYRRSLELRVPERPAGSRPESLPLQTSIQQEAWRGPEQSVISAERESQ